MDASISAPLDIAAVRSEFSGASGYLAACTTGLPTRATRRAVLADLDAAAAGRPDVTAYTAAAEAGRAAFARIVGVPADRVAIGSQTSVMAALVAASLPDGSEVLCPEGDFSSIVLPFVHAGRGIRVRTAPLARLADAIAEDTALVAFSLVQSATGEVADAGAIAAAADRHDVRTFCDATQAIGWLPVDATRFDAVVCHAYKWLCSPRGVAFLALGPAFAATLRPIFAGWYAGADPWASCYGSTVDLATDARRFDVSPAWQACIGAEPALRLFADLDPAAAFAHTTGLANAFRHGMGLPGAARSSAIVTWADSEGDDLVRMSTAGITASGRAGRTRVAFHVFNDDDDVERALRALGR